MDPTSLVITVAIIGLVLYKQFTGRFVRSGNREMAIPFVILALGLVTVVTAHPAVTATGLALLAAELVIVAGLGVVRGYGFRLESRDGWLYRRGSAALLGAWVLTIGVRVVAEMLGGAVGAGALISTTSALVFGGSLLVQAFVLRTRVATAGVPVRPAASRRGSLV